jgi:hypothetical protein
LSEYTGLSREGFDRLVWLLEPVWEEYRAARVEEARAERGIPRRNALGAGRPGVPFASRVFLAVAMLRTNATYRQMEADWGVGKDTLNRSVRALSELIAGLGVATPDGGEIRSPAELAARLEAMARPPAGEESEGPDGGGSGGFSGAAVVDGSYTQAGRPRGWEAQKARYSGHRHLHCWVWQTCCDLYGNVLWVSGPFPGATHDLTALAECGLGRQLAAANVPVLVDKGYQGIAERIGLDPARVFGPKRKPKGGDLGPSERRRNRAVAQLRVVVEHVHERLKNWKILVRYRGRQHNFGHIIGAVAVLLTLPNRLRTTR